MSRYQRLRTKPTTFRQLTGPTVAAFDQRRDELEPVPAARAAGARSRRPRRRNPGAGRKPKLGPDDRLVLVLMYYRVYVTQVVLGGLFGVDAGTACRVIRAAGLARTGVFRIPERKVRLGADELADALADALVDATGPPTYRPKRGRRRYYSGKKRHATRHQVVVRKKERPGRGGPRPRKVRVAAVPGAAPGSTHDKKVYDRSGLELPAGVPGAGDTAYLGTGLRVPTRRPRGRPPTGRRKAGSRRLARRRVVEHGIGKMKVWRIAADRDRNPRSRHTVMMKNVAGLHNRMFG
jgi:DDE superfamily endonuclease